MKVVIYIQENNEFDDDWYMCSLRYLIGAILLYKVKNWQIECKLRRKSITLLRNW